MTSSRHFGNWPPPKPNGGNERTDSRCRDGFRQKDPIGTPCGFLRRSASIDASRYRIPGIARTEKNVGQGNVGQGNGSGKEIPFPCPQFACHLPSRRLPHRWIPSAKCHLPSGSRKTGCVRRKPDQPSVRRSAVSPVRSESIGSAGGTSDNSTRRRRERNSPAMNSKNTPPMPPATPYNK